jgi:prepilin-type N-terminal cleavage/methylation domain-containing protein
LIDRRQGFTLIELLIVVVVIGILASIAIPKFGNTREKAFVASMQSDLRNLFIAEENYHATFITFTSSMAAMEAISSQGVTVTLQNVSGTGWAAITSHIGTTKSCAVYVGGASVTAPATESAIVSCD